MKNGESQNPQSEKLAAQLTLAHRGLLAVHKALLDHEKTRYERERGRIGSPGELLQLVIGDPWFAWLRPVSLLITRIDEFVEAREPVDPREGEALIAQSRALLVPLEDGNDFQRQYHRDLQESPEVALAHGQWKLSLLQMDRK